MVTRYRIEGTNATELVRSIETGLLRGLLGPGEPLPPIRRLAGDLGMSPATVASAYAMLRQRGIAVGRGRAGTTLLPRPPIRTRPAPPLPQNVVDLALGNPDPKQLPRLRANQPEPTLYGAPRVLPDLARVAQRDFARDGIPASTVVLSSGALDGIERALQANLHPGDIVGVEDPMWPNVVDLVRSLSLTPAPMTIDDKGVTVEGLERALVVGARAVIVTPRAQNPTGAAFDTARTAALRERLQIQPVFVIEDDHAAWVAGRPLASLVQNGYPGTWVAIRSLAKSLGPDVRLAFVTGDELTMAKIDGRQAIGMGWVSHLLQRAVLNLLGTRTTRALLARASHVYSERRSALIEALEDEGIQSHGASGLNVWLPVTDEMAVVTGLLGAGWAVAAGERFRQHSEPAVRITISTLDPRLARQLARDVSRSMVNANASQPA